MDVVRRSKSKVHIHSIPLHCYLMSRLMNKIDYYRVGQKRGPYVAGYRAPLPEAEAEFMQPFGHSVAQPCTMYCTLTAICF